MLVGKILCIILASILQLGEALAQKRVYSYVAETQDQRRESRWTLTEWLHIKERMKMMDLWLALFGESKTQKFAPELSLHYQKGRMDDIWSSSLKPDRLQAKSDSEAARVQFWFTNLVSASTGLRTLDIDLGLEGSLANRYAAPLAEYSPGEPKLEPLGAEKSLETSLNFRLFGRHVQDSGLVLKLGKYQHQPAWAQALGDQSHGIYQAVETTLYLLPWLGLEGRWALYQKGAMDDYQVRGWSRSASGFLEVYALRLGYGLDQRSFRYESPDQLWRSMQNEGFFFLRLHF